MEKYFFEIPIFRCEQQEFLREIKEEIRKTSDFLKLGNEGIDFNYEDLAARNIYENLSSYRYGELVGMIRLFCIPNQIRAEFYSVKQKITKKLKNKTWSSKGKAFEIWIRQNDTNRTIYKRILERLDSYQKESKRLYKCFIDKNCFENAGKYIDFLSCVGSSL